MDKVFVGRIVNTHGIKGEIRILSDFEHKDKVFKVGTDVIIKDHTYKITSYRVHKNFDMITLEGFNDINLVLPFKGANLFVDRSVLKLDEEDYLLEDLIDMNVFLDDENLGIVTDYTTGKNALLMVKYNDKMYYIPLNGNFISNVDLNNNKIYVTEDTKGLII